MDESLWQETQFFLSPLIFSFERKKSWKFVTHKWPLLTVFGHLFANFMNFFHETEVQTVILRCLVSLNLNGIKSYYIILAKKKFFGCLKMHRFEGYFAEVSFETSERNQRSYFQSAYFDKILWWSHEPQNQRICR